jgi:uncharacterized protein (DUF433 family)
MPSRHPERSEGSAFRPNITNSPRHHSRPLRCAPTQASITSEYCFATFSITAFFCGGLFWKKEAHTMPAALDWSQCPAVESVPDRRSGAWVFKDTRMPVSTVFENLEVGSSIEEIIEQYDVTREQIQAVLEFAARSLDAPPVPVGAANRSAAHPV